jgi:D-sedoheptulose 7-phosphate isomerase
MQSPSQIITSALNESIAVKQALVEREIPLIVHIAELMARTFESGHKVVLFGNGGSAADAQHVAAELVGRFMLQRTALPAIALTTDTSILTSIGNDFAFDQVFVRQIEALVQAGDLAVGISTSGDSPNILGGITAAKQKGATTLGFTGLNGGKLKELADICFCAPSERTARIQEAHITVWHAICEAVEARLFGA